MSWFNKLFGSKKTPETESQLPKLSDKESLELKVQQAEDGFILLHKRYERAKQEYESRTGELGRDAPESIAAYRRMRKIADEFQAAETTFVVQMKNEEARRIMELMQIEMNAFESMTEGVDVDEIEVDHRLAGNEFKEKMKTAEKSGQEWRARSAEISNSVKQNDYVENTANVKTVNENVKDEE